MIPRQNCAELRSIGVPRNVGEGAAQLAFWRAKDSLFRKRPRKLREAQKCELAAGNAGLLSGSAGERLSKAAFGGDRVLNVVADDTDRFRLRHPGQDRDVVKLVYRMLEA